MRWMGGLDYTPPIALGSFLYSCCTGHFSVPLSRDTAIPLLVCRCRVFYDSSEFFRRRGVYRFFFIARYTFCLRGAGGGKFLL
jgi:hypothetical protein